MTTACASVRSCSQAVSEAKQCMQTVTCALQKLSISVVFSNIFQVIAEIREHVKIALDC